MFLSEPDFFLIFRNLETEIKKTNSPLSLRLYFLSYFKTAIPFGFIKNVFFILICVEQIMQILFGSKNKVTVIPLLTLIALIPSKF